MSEEHDRVVTESILRSALNDLENRLKKRLGTRLEKRLAKRISEEGQTSRRHMDVIAERLESHLKLVPTPAGLGG